MKKKYVTELENHNLTKENLIIVKKRMLTRNVLMFVIFLVILLITAVGAPRIKIFIKAFSSTSHIFQIIGIVLYLASLTTIVLYYAIILFQIYVNRDNDEWVYKIYGLKKKLDLVTFTCKCLSIFLFILIYILNPCTVDGTSMNDTFLENDKVICTDVFYYPKKNDVIVFNAKRYSGKNELYIKRVVAIEDDEVTYIDGILYINGEKEQIQRLSNSNFTKLIQYIDRLDGTLVENGAIVPKGMIVVLGDNREHSYDSGEFGPIYINDIYGKVIMRVFPFDKIRLF